MIFRDWAIRLSRYQNYTHPINKFMTAAALIAPVFDSVNRSVEKVCQAIADAARESAQLAAYPETLVPYYPYFSHMLPPVASGSAHFKLCEYVVVVLSANERHYGVQHGNDAI